MGKAVFKSAVSKETVPDGARIDVIGNANNYPLALVHGLREIGFDAHLHLTMPGELNAPENRYAAYAHGYPDWVHDWRELGDALWCSSPMMKAVRKEAETAAALVLNYDAVSLGAEESRPYFCLLTGTDLLCFADPQKVRTQFVPHDRATLNHYPNRAYARSWIEFCLRQRSAVRHAQGYSFFPRGTLPSADEILESIGAAPERQLSLLITEVDAATPPVRRRVGPLQVLVGARLTWDRTSKPLQTELDYKGTDIILRGVAEFINHGGQADVLLFRKGVHIRQTEDLVKNLELSAYVHWRDEMRQIEFLNAVRNADIVVDAVGGAHIGMVTVDAMGAGKPVIATAPDFVAWNWPEPLPICNVHTASDIAVWLKKMATDPDSAMQIAVREKAFAEKYFSIQQAARRVITSLRRAAQHRESILFQTLSVCREYDESNYKMYMNMMNKDKKFDQIYKENLFMKIKSRLRKIEKRIVDTKNKKNV